MFTYCLSEGHAAHGNCGEIYHNIQIRCSNPQCVNMEALKEIIMRWAKIAILQLCTDVVVAVLGILFVVLIPTSQQETENKIFRKLAERSKRR